ncbi:hypothetical protein Pmar_PMAR023002 [Perkinsus marinus ATCC 50983]|uniref:Uncharacterized protein n=1 Tax=Perkinsus marinus (strain ATCC 50983 / TXsc) TaxID=423536 RepID=C5LHV1_PERM5|nr:hypothetical protein Pmar_PMAR023002 [Perkinsus marinus ATCC 50983]EER03705.1 hypothetical protein Pmar_PMAR023002 [Perkinsus marinus ATCC 50983]|eukprot:XP_002771889.1 hypothetical protein Pmar_PMAR023002 [Perkinsus marinus ATCC 50983]
MDVHCLRESSVSTVNLRLALCDPREVLALSLTYIYLYYHTLGPRPQRGSIENAQDAEVEEIQPNVENTTTVPAGGAAPIDQDDEKHSSARKGRGAMGCLADRASQCFEQLKNSTTPEEEINSLNKIKDLFAEIERGNAPRARVVSAETIICSQLVQSDFLSILNRAKSNEESPEGSIPPELRELSTWLIEKTVPIIWST